MDKTRVKKREKIICRRLIPQAESWVYWHLPLLLSHTLSSYHALPLIPSILSTAVSRRHPGATGPSILTCKQIGLEPQDWPGASGSDLYVAPPFPFPALHFRGLHFLGGVQTMGGAGGRVLGSWVEEKLDCFFPSLSAVIATACLQHDSTAPVWSCFCQCLSHLGSNMTFSRCPSSLEAEAASRLPQYTYSGSSVLLSPTRPVHFLH